MEGGCRRREHEGERDQSPDSERGSEKEEEGEREADEAPSAEGFSSCSLAPSTSISLSNVKEDRCIVLDNLFDGAIKRDDEFCLSVRNHLHGNSARCGPVHHIHVDRECGRGYMLFDSVRSANKAAEKWHQSSYQGNVITVSFADTAEYKTRFGAETIAVDLTPDYSILPALSRSFVGRVAPLPRSAGEMEGGCRGEHEGERDQRPEGGREKEEEGEREADEAPSAEGFSSCSVAPSTSISLSNVKKDRCIVLDNLFDGAIERDDEFCLSVRNHLHGNSARCGPVHHIHVDRECGRAYILFDSVRSANKAAEKWHQSLYQGNVITVSFTDTAEYKTRFEAELPRTVSYHSLCVRRSW